MSIPSEERKQIIVSSTSDERQSKGIIVKGTYWVVFSSFGNLHMREFEGSYSLRLGIAAPQFHLTPALDSGLNILSDRFWLWKVDMDDNLDLVEVEPVVGGPPIIHDITRIGTGVVNIRANVRDGYPVNVYCVTAAGSLVLKIYSDIKSATPLKIVDLEWSPTRLDSFDTVSYGDEVHTAYLDVLSPPNVYTEDYSLTVPELFTGAQIGITLQTQLAWDNVTGAEAYRLERAINDPSFTGSTWQYTGMNTSFVDTVPAYETDYYYRVKLEVPSMGLESLWSTGMLVEIGPPPAYPPVANFVADHTVGNVPMAVAFQDLSTNIPTLWRWNFGDGYTGGVQNPVHTYNAPGTYTVDLYVSNVGGDDTETKAAYISVYPFTVSVDFTADRKVGVSAFAVQFTSEVLTGEVRSYLWKFGDGTTSTLAHPLHTYEGYGYYSVTLLVTDPSGVPYSVHKPGYVRIGKMGIAADPSVSDSAPVSVYFFNNCLAPTGYEFNDWSWNFGDVTLGSGATGPTHIYNEYGSYNVSLEAKLKQR